MFLKYFKIASPPHLSPALILEREANLSLTISFDEANRSLIRLSRFNSMNNKNLMDNKTKFFARNNKDSNLHVFAATSLSKSNSVNNKNSLNNKMNNNGEKQLLTNGNNSNLINNNETIKNTNNSKVSLYLLYLSVHFGHQEEIQFGKKRMENDNFILRNTKTEINFQANTSLEEISPWLVTDSITVKKKESKIPIMKTVITTEL